MSCREFKVKQRIRVKTTITARYEGSSTTVRLEPRKEGTIVEIDNKETEHRVKVNFGLDKNAWIDPHYLMEIGPYG